MPDRIVIARDSDDTLVNQDEFDRIDPFIDDSDEMMAVDIAMRGDDEDNQRDAAIRSVSRGNHFSFSQSFFRCLCCQCGTVGGRF